MNSITTNYAPRDAAAREIFVELARRPIFDPHSHIDPHRPAARCLDEILGYHYYTELAHSAGMPADRVAPDSTPSSRVRAVAEYLPALENTAQYRWLLHIAQTFFGFEHNSINAANIGELEARADHEADGAAWDAAVWSRSKLDAVFLTNEFDDPLSGWDTSKYIPCLRVDDLVLKLHLPATVERLRAATGLDVGDFNGLRAALAAVFERFKVRGARACAISLPPDFVPSPAEPRRVVTPIRRALRGLPVRPDEVDDLRRTAFWTIAELCSDHKLPFDLMIGPIRGVYPAGVAGGRDLFDRRVSLHDYAPLFNHFADVAFPISTLTPDAAAELTAYAWIFPNVLPFGHWWYSNIPAFIAHDLRARLQALPATKLLGYYSDAYKLEFILPKFTMYRAILAESLAEECVRGRGWSTPRALELAQLVLWDNPRRLFGFDQSK